MGTPTSDVLPSLRLLHMVLTQQEEILFFFNIYLFGCIGSWLQHVGSSLRHCGAWTRVVEHGFSSCYVGLVVPWHVGS